MEYNKNPGILYAAGEACLDDLNRFINEEIRKNKDLRRLAEDGARIILAVCSDSGLFNGRVDNAVDFCPGGLLPIRACRGDGGKYPTIDDPFDDTHEIDPEAEICDFGAYCTLTRKGRAIFLGSDGRDLGMLKSLGHLPCDVAISSRSPFRDPLLMEAWRMLRPSRWVFPHHENIAGREDGCEWMGLAPLGDGGWAKFIVEG